MFRVIIFIVLVGYCSQSTAIDLPKIDGKIIGGISINIRQHPYQASIQIGRSHICGGTLYKPNIVITAAHCMQKVNVRQLRVRLGSSTHMQGGVLVSVQKFIIHPNYNPKTMDNDVALLRLTSSVPLNANIQTIDITNQAPLPTTQAIVTGWGVLNEQNNRLPIRLQKVTVTILSNPQCSLPPYDYSVSQISNAMMCAFSSNKDACQGDSGGPLVANGKLVGIVSWGYGCARKNYPGVYTNVAACSNWIISSANSI